MYFQFHWVGGNRWRTRPKDVTLMNELPPHVQGAYLKSRRNVAAYLDKLQKGKRAGG